jgi:hypothetical protein
LKKLENATKRINTSVQKAMHIVDETTDSNSEMGKIKIHKERRNKKDRMDETRDVISIQNDDLLGLRFSKEEILNDFNHSVVAVPP